jgi:hypothetical protein
MLLAQLDKVTAEYTEADRKVAEPRPPWTRPRPSGSTRATAAGAAQGPPDAVTKWLTFLSTGYDQGVYPSARRPGEGVVYLWMEREWKPEAAAVGAIFTPAEARTVAARLLRSADRAEGKEA